LYPFITETQNVAERKYEKEVSVRKGYLVHVSVKNGQLNMKKAYRKPQREEENCLGSLRKRGVRQKRIPRVCILQNICTRSMYPSEKDTLNVDT
jgi:hypothetical protein